MTQTLPADVQAAYEQVPEADRAILTMARARIFECAKAADVGPLTETLKWGQPAYLTGQTKAGSTIRLGLHQAAPAAFFTCSSSLVDSFRADFPDALTYHGNRAITLRTPFPPELDLCFDRALTYHRSARNL